MKFAVIDWTNPGSWDAARKARKCDLGVVSHRWTKAPLLARDTTLPTPAPCLASAGFMVTCWNQEPRADDPVAVGALKAVLPMGGDKINGARRYMRWSGSLAEESLLMLDVRNAAAMTALANYYKLALPWAAGLFVDYWTNPRGFSPDWIDLRDIAAMDPEQIAVFDKSWSDGLTFLAGQLRAVGLLVGGAEWQETWATASLDVRLVEQYWWRWGAYAFHSSPAQAKRPLILELRTTSGMTAQQLFDTMRLAEQTNSYVTFGRDASGKGAP